MRALLISTYGDPEVLVVRTVPDPEPAADQVLVRVHGAPLQVADLALRAGLLADVMPDASLPMSVGWELAGVVEAVGAAVTRLEPGNRVVGMSRHFFTRIGSHAELVAVPAADVAVVPDELDLVAASTLPIALTAVQALDLLKVRKGSSVLVTGAAGTVGRYAVRLAHLRGAQVLASAAPRDSDLLADLGADVQLDRQHDLAHQVHQHLPSGVDALLDTAVLGQPALTTVKDNGHAVALLLPAPAPERGITPQVVFVEPDKAQLAKLLTAVTNGSLTLPAYDTYPLDQASQAHRRLASGGLRKRLVFTPELAIKRCP